MQISSINSNYNKKTSYKGIERTVYKQNTLPKQKNLRDNNVLHKNTSWMFRPELWQCRKFYSYFSKAFKDVNKVNVYNYGCSLGYEAFSYVMWLLSGKPKNPEKFLPIIAKDYDEEIISAARNYQILLYQGELRSIKNVIKGKKLNEFMQLGEYSHYSLFNTEYYGYLANLTNKLKDNVKFSVADIRDDYVNIEPKNSIVMATNFWPYMGKNDRYKLAENLYKHLDKGSYVKIGEFDNNCFYLNDKKTTATILSEVGFKKTAYPGSILKR